MDETEQGGRARGAVRAADVRAPMAPVLDEMFPGWRERGAIPRADYIQARRRYLERLIARDRGEIGDLERSVAAAVAGDQLLDISTEAAIDRAATYGERMADRVTRWGGSWTFILSFSAFLLIWAATNAWILSRPARFDPYPFVFLNLILSCVAAFQAPIIMMSQSRQEAKDRLRAMNDYRVNLKAELEIRLLHEKIDQMILRQGEHLAELEQLLLDQIEDLRDDSRDL